MYEIPFIYLLISQSYITNTILTSIPSIQSKQPSLVKRQCNTNQTKKRRKKKSDYARTEVQKEIKRGLDWENLFVTFVV